MCLLYPTVKGGQALPCCPLIYPNAGCKAAEIYTPAKEKYPEVRHPVQDVGDRHAVAQAALDEGPHVERAIDFQAAEDHLAGIVRGGNMLGSTQQQHRAWFQKKRERKPCTLPNTQ